jgi:1,4-alpha-glucan branching enzyme
MQSEAHTTTILVEETELLTPYDLYLFNEGTHLRVYEKLGAHLVQREGVSGVHFAVWAPNARQLSVVGDFNGWDPESHPLAACGESGVWAGFVPQVPAGAAYRYHIQSKHQGYQVEKLDPVGLRLEGSPRHASQVWDLHYEWHDHEWMGARARHQTREAPWAIYEVHLASWMRVPEEQNRQLTLRELAPRLADYVSKLGFTHVALNIVMAHPSGSARHGQVTAYFAPAHQAGTPQDLMFLIDYLHQHNLGVILDWTPAHFPAAEPSLAYFDGTHLYEHGFCELALPGAPRACTFDFEKREVNSFLLSSAFFWLAEYHADGLRVGSLAAILYLDYGREPGTWVPNPHGGRENLAGIAFLRQLNADLYRHFPDTQTIAEETTSWPLVSRPAHTGGLGFGFKCAHEFAHDTLRYFEHDPFFRKFHHQDLTARASQAFAENNVLPLSRPTVAAGPRSLLARLPGDDWQRLANLRLLLGYFYLQPGKKLLFMGVEFGQWRAWDPEGSLDWHLCHYTAHRGVQQWVRDLNQVYRTEQALFTSDFAAAGLEWVDASDSERSTLSWLRRDPARREVILAVANLTPVVRRNFRAGVRRPGHWREILNSDAREYGGSGQGNFGGVLTAPFTSHGFPHTLVLTLPPLALVVLKYEVAPFT